MLLQEKLISIGLYAGQIDAKFNAVILNQSVFPTDKARRHVNIEGYYTVNL